MPKEQKSNTAQLKEKLKEKIIQEFLDDKPSLGTELKELRNKYVTSDINNTYNVKLTLDDIKDIAPQDAAKIQKLSDKEANRRLNNVKATINYADFNSRTDARLALLNNELMIERRKKEVSMLEEYGKKINDSIEKLNLMREDNATEVDKLIDKRRAALLKNNSKIQNLKELIGTVETYNYIIRESLGNIRVKNVSVDLAHKQKKFKVQQKRISKKLDTIVENSPLEMKEPKKNLNSTKLRRRHQIRQKNDDLTITTEKQKNEEIIKRERALKEVKDTMKELVKELEPNNRFKRLLISNFKRVRDRERNKETDKNRSKGLRLLQELKEQKVNLKNGIKILKNNKGTIKVEDIRTNVQKTLDEAKNQISVIEQADTTKTLNKANEPELQAQKVINKLSQNIEKQTTPTQSYPSQIGKGVIKNKIINQNNPKR